MAGALLVLSGLASGGQVALTFRVDVGGPNPTSFSERILIDEFVAGVETYDFGGGNGLQKISFGQQPMFSGTPFTSSLTGSLPWTTQDIATISSSMFGERGQYSSNGAPSGGVNSQLRLTRGKTTLVQAQDGIWDYANYYQNFYAGSLGSGGIEEFDTHELVAFLWSTPLLWSESASLARNYDYRGFQPAPGGFSTYYSGMATLIAVEGLVSEPATLAVAPLALLVVGLVRRRTGTTRPRNLRT